MLVVLRRMPPGIFLQALNARAMTRWEAPAIIGSVTNCAKQSVLELPPLLSRVRGQVPAAFTIDGGATAIIVLSQSLIEIMSAREIRAILPHEIIHLRNGDLALMQLAVAVARLTRVLSQAASLLVFLSLMLRAVSAVAFPLLPLLVLAVAPLGVNLLQLALSREREAEADLEAAELTGDPYGLASALIKMRNCSATTRRPKSVSAASWRCCQRRIGTSPTSPQAKFGDAAAPVPGAEPMLPSSL
jgi:heat shock protein HtpX